MNGLAMSTVSHWVSVIVTPIPMKRLLSIAHFLRSYLIQQKVHGSLYTREFYSDAVNISHITHGSNLMANMLA
jgi:hypothetical protein